MERDERRQESAFEVAQTIAADDPGFATAHGMQPTLRIRHLIIAGCALFLGSNLLFAPALRLAPALLLVIGCGLACALVVYETRVTSALDAPIDLRLLSLCFASAFAIFVVAGLGHLFYAADDWLVRDAVLTDLTRASMPIVYDYEGATWALRAPLGMYVAPALAGRVAGLGVAHAAMLAQNTVLLGLSLYLLAMAVDGARSVVVALILAFSGLDVLGEAMRSGLTNLPMHLEGWNPLFEYSSAITQMFWVPNHALPAWWFAALVVLHIRGADLPATMVVMFAALLLWSPLAMMGAAPFVLAAAVRHWRLIATPLAIAAIATAACFVPVAVYLMSDAASVPNRWLIGEQNFAFFYILFISLEIPHAIVVVAAPTLRREPWLSSVMLALALLLALPFYKLGASNDFVMRASIVSLVILACGFATAVIELATTRHWIATTIAGAIILIGAATPLTEIFRNITMPRFAISTCDFITSWSEAWPTLFANHYLARLDRMPDWLLAEPRQRMERHAQGATCWPDHPSRKADPMARVPATENFARSADQPAFGGNRTNAEKSIGFKVQSAQYAEIRLPPFSAGR